jgi:hypothetical protein
VAAAIAGSGLPADRVQEFLIAIAEVVANALKHGGDPARLALWVTGDGSSARSTTPDPALRAPLAGSLPPRSAKPSRGTGLWIAR